MDHAEKIAAALDQCTEDASRSYAEAELEKLYADQNAGGYGEDTANADALERIRELKNILQERK
jgi:hypothetical protein